MLSKDIFGDEVGTTVILKDSNAKVRSYRFNSDGTKKKDSSTKDGSGVEISGTMSLIGWGLRFRRKTYKPTTGMVWDIFFSDFPCRFEIRRVGTLFHHDIFHIYHNPYGDRWELKVEEPLKWKNEAENALSKYQAKVSFDKLLFEYAKSRGKFRFTELLPQISNLASKLRYLKSEQEQIKYIINNLTQLIVDDKLKGVINPSRGMFVSDMMVGTETVQYNVDFSSLAKLLLDKGLVVQTLECPHCSGRIGWPVSGNTTTCENCGREVYAVDTFEKFRGLL